MGDVGGAGRVLTGIRVLVLDGRDGSVAGPNPTGTARATVGRLLVLALRYFGCEVVWIKPGDEYLQLAGTVDLVLVHLNFGKREGFHTTRTGLRAAEDIAARWPSVPLIVYTAHAADARDLALPPAITGHLIDITLILGGVDPLPPPSPSERNEAEDEECTARRAEILEDIGERLCPFVQAPVALARAERKYRSKPVSFGQPSVGRATIPQRFGIEGFTDGIALAILRTVLGESRSRAEAADAMGITIDEVEKAKVEFGVRDEPGGLREAELAAVDPRRILLVGFDESEWPDLAATARARGNDPIFVSHAHLAASKALRIGAGCALVKLADGTAAVAAKGVLRIPRDCSLLLVCKTNVSLPALCVVEHLGLAEYLVTAENVDAYGRALDIASERATLMADAGRQLDLAGRGRFANPRLPPNRLDLELWEDGRGRVRRVRGLWRNLIEAALERHSTIRKTADVLGLSSTVLCRVMQALGIRARNPTPARGSVRGVGGP